MVISVDCVLSGCVISVPVGPPSDVLPPPPGLVVVLRVVVGVVVGARLDKNEIIRQLWIRNYVICTI